MYFLIFHGQSLLFRLGKCIFAGRKVLLRTVKRTYTTAKRTYRIAKRTYRTVKRKLFQDKITINANDEKNHCNT